MRENPPGGVQNGRIVRGRKDEIKEAGLINLSQPELCLSSEGYITMFPTY